MSRLKNSSVLNGVNSRKMPYIKKQTAEERWDWDKRQKGRAMLGRIFKVLLFLLVLGFIGLTGFAYLGDLSPDQSDIREPVTLNVE